MKPSPEAETQNPKPSPEAKTENPKPTPQATAKKPYNKPVLKVYGTIEVLTATVAPNSTSDGGGAGMNRTS
jgi:hypothetical protein